MVASLAPPLLMSTPTPGSSIGVGFSCGRGVTVGGGGGECNGSASTVAPSTEEASPWKLLKSDAPQELGPLARD